MPPDTTERNPNRSGTLFGLYGREAKRHDNPLVVTDETTAWEIYNYKASEVDRELIKDWNSSLNTLLIFSALYSAVLTAFIVESMKMLEENPAETSRDILLIISRQLANTSYPVFEQATYQTPQYAVVVNGLFFTSLCCTLIAALLSVLALQWVASYDMGLNTSSPRKRALQRHIRFRGIQYWKMAELIASLPLLLFVALLLFSAGIATWLWYTNRTISWITISGIGIGCFLYFITNPISIANVDASLHNKRKTNSGNTIEQQRTLTKHEEREIDWKDALTMDGLVWLTNSIEISSTSRKSFIILIKELTKVPAPSLMDDEKIKDVPWEAIFEMLCSPYIEKSEYNGDELERARWICKGMGIIPQFLSPTCQRFLSGLRNLDDQSVASMAYFASYKQYSRQDLPWQERGNPIIMTSTAFKHTSKSIKHIGDNYFHFMLLNAKKQWPDLERWDRMRLVESMGKAWAISSATIRDGSSSIIIPVRFIQFILDFVLPPVEINRLEARYFAVVYRGQSSYYWDGQWNTVLRRLLRTMTQQLIAQIAYKSNTVYDITKELGLFSFIMESERLNLVEEKDDFIWVMIDKFTGCDEPRESERIGNILCHGLHRSTFRLAWANLVLTLDKFVARLPPHSFYFYSKITHFIEASLASSVKCHDNSKLNVLERIRDPCIAWVVSWRCSPDIRFQALLHPNFSKWNDTIENEVIRSFNNSSRTLRTFAKSDARISFLRAIILEAPPNARMRALGCLGRYMRSSDEKWSQFFASPMLSVILEQSIASEEFPIHSLLPLMAKYQWFYEEFSRANGLEWLPLIAQNANPIDDQPLKSHALTEILVDQILFSTVNPDIQAPLSSSYYYLLSLGQTLPQIEDRKLHRRLSNLRIALLWVFSNLIKAHNLQGHVISPSLPVIGPPTLKRVHWKAVGEARSFDFMNDLSGDECETWGTRLKVLIMGTHLGGLKPGPIQRKSRFYRDPDGVCGLV